MSKYKKPPYYGRDVLDAIWASAYGAAFVLDFERFKEFTGFDNALKHASAEAAETIADRAVAEWLRWNKEGKA